MRLLFLTKYPRRGPSSRYRVLQYLPFLEARGFACDVRSLHSDRYMDLLYAGRKAPVGYGVGRLAARIRDCLAAPRYDAVFIQKELVPYAPPILEAYLRIRRVPVVYDVDDAIWLLYAGSPRPLVRALLGGKMPRVLGWSDFVLAGNAYLERYAAGFARRTVLVPTVIDPNRYAAARHQEGDAALVWIGSPETVGYLAGIGAALGRLGDRAGVTLRVIGAPSPAMPGVRIETAPWSEATEAAELARGAVGLMPLPANEWAMGKCGLKLLQYMAAALPVVSSPGGSAEEIVEEGVTGFIARTETEWAERLARLLDDRDLRRRMGLAGRRRVEERYSLDVWAPRLGSLLEEAARRGGREGCA